LIEADGSCGNRCVGAQARHTILTTAYSGRLARVVRNRFSEEMTASAEPVSYPAGIWFANSLSAPAIIQGRGDMIWVQAGQTASLLRHHLVEELFFDLVAEIELALRTASSQG
jgi:nitronate monooxygenase